MTGRDRLVILGVLVLVVLAGGWLLLVSPERKQAAQAQAQIESARQALQTAQAQAASERSAEARYTSAYVAVVRLGKAVPPLEELPSLVYELDQASNQHSIEFNSMTTASTSSSAAAAASTPGAAAFTQMPFTFIFKGTFFGLAHLLGQIDGFARTTFAKASATSTAADTRAPAPTGVQVSGRLLTIQGVSLAIESKGGAGATSTSGGELSATITATAYVLPTGQTLTGGATPTGPAGTAGASSAAPASSPASPAVIQGGP
jgi:hypothetical protein